MHYISYNPEKTFKKYKGLETERLYWGVGCNEQRCGIGRFGCNSVIKIELYDVPHKL